MKRSGFFTLGKVLIAAVAICAAAPSAKADLATLNLTSEGSTTTATFNLSAGPGSGANVQVGDFTISYKVTEQFVNGTESLSFQVTSVTKGNSTQTGAGTLIYSLTDSSVSNPASGTGTLVNSLSSGSFGGAGANQKVTANASYSDFVNGSSPSPSPLSFTGGSSGSSTSHSAISSINTPYTLQTSGALTNVKNGSSGSFTATASVVDAPEPSAVIAALAGLPCMGLLVGFARRRRALEQAATAM